MKKLCLVLYTIIFLVLPLGLIDVCQADEGDRMFGIPSMARRVPVFMYHDFTEAAHVEESKEGLYVSRQTFEEQLKYLKEKGCTSIGFDELLDFIRDGTPVPRNSFIITIDDVYKEQYTIAYPMLKEYGFKATLFINTASVGEEHRYGWKELKEMEDSGYINVQSHGEYHLPMNGIRLHEAALNVAHSFELIEKYLGPRKVRVFCYPSYSCNRKTRSLLESMVDMQVTKLGKYVYRDSSTGDIYRFRATNNMTGKDLYEIINR